MSELRLEGLAEPVLAHYLAALGVFRSIAMQVDSGATLRFDPADVPVIVSTLDEEGWTRWVLEEWVPSVILSPWNSGAGFYGSSKAVGCTDGEKRHGVALIQASSDARLAAHRSVSDWALSLLEAMGGADEVDKDQLLARLRNTGPEELLPWLDAATVVERDGDAPNGRYPSLLGTGGNDGRLDLGNNYLLHLGRLLSFEGNLMKRPKNAEKWSLNLLTALLGSRAEGLLKDSAGQFAPSGRAAPNADSGAKSYAGDKQINPWLFIWSVEGTLFFSGAATRRLGTHGRAKAAFPFHADRVDAGYGSAAAEKGKDELWLPLWQRPTGYLELGRLFAEARTQVGRRVARSGTDFARAIGGLGATRGLHGFHRFALLERAGQSNIAVHSGRFAAGESRILDRLREVDGYLRRFERIAGSLPRLRRAWHGFEQATMELARRSDPRRVTALLAALGQLRRQEALGLPSDAKLGRFSLQTAEWLFAAEPSTELRLALALASLDGSAPHGPLRDYLWDRASHGLRNPGQLALRPLATALLTKRLVEHRTPGPGALCLPAGGASLLTCDDLIRFSASAVDEALVEALLWCFADLPTEAIHEYVDHYRVAHGALHPRVPRPWMVLRLSVTGEVEGAPVRAPVGLLQSLRGNPAEAQRKARHVLRAAGHPSKLAAPRRAPALSPAWSAALAFPLPRPILAAFAHEVLIAKETQ